MTSVINLSIWKAIPMISTLTKRAGYMMESRRPFFSEEFGNVRIIAPNPFVTCQEFHQPRFEKNGRRLARLTDFPVFIWPNFLDMQRTLFLDRFLINDYDDPTFDYGDFALFALSLVDCISANISIKDFSALKKFVTRDFVQEIREEIRDIPAEELTDFWTRSRDVVFSFPHEIKTVKDENSTRVAEVLMVFHVVKGSYKRITYPKAPLAPSELKDNVQVLNYRFARLLDMEDDSYWVVNGLNHIRFFNAK